ncbi:hypothetical protein ACFPT7_15555 [Acidicapsa dinghuensis]|uniref:Uncharacterized protein n=1 Tax=Acidicapsa dinghuensis TaxID=2218256 RepID=A0ABW1EJY7_9BACT|nr:hypothetical protein [Acidicapsa dinghuensis]
MQIHTSILRSLVAATLTVLFITPTSSIASPKPLDPVTVHKRILKRGEGNWIAVQENNGVDLFGRIITIGDRSFTLQLHNDPQTTEIYYSDVAYLRTGFTTGQKIFMIGGIAAVAGVSIWGFVHIHNLENKQLSNQPTPVFP